MIPNPISQYLMMGKLVALLGAIALICWQSSQIHRWHKHSDSEHAAHERDNAAYRQAQKDAGLANHAHVAAKEAESKRITDETQSSYARDHAELVRLRQRARAAPGASNGAGSPAPSGPASGADANGLPVPSADDVQAASEIELRLMHLQNWVERQLSVDPNAP